MKTRRAKKRYEKNKTLKNFLFNPNNPSKSFDVYIDKNPNDTIPIKYTTVTDVKETIEKLEQLYKVKKYSHKRIWQVGMIMKVRLKAMKAKKPAEYKLAERYFQFLKDRTGLSDEKRYKIVFTI